MQPRDVFSGGYEFRVMRGRQCQQMFCIALGEMVMVSKSGRMDMNKAEAVNGVKKLLRAPDAAIADNPLSLCGVKADSGCMWQSNTSRSWRRHIPTKA